MPIITALLISGRTPEKKAAFITAVTEAAVRSLEVPPDSVRVIIQEIPGEHFAVAGVTKKPLVPE